MSELEINNTTTQPQEEEEVVKEEVKEEVEKEEVKEEVEKEEVTPIEVQKNGGEDVSATKEVPESVPVPEKEKEKEKESEVVVVEESKPKQPEEEEVIKKEEKSEVEVEEECQTEYKPIVSLQEVKKETGEEHEGVIFEQKCKLYRFVTDEWKERGTGFAKILKSNNSSRVRMVMREEKTLKIRSNHLLLPTSKLEWHSGSDRAIVFTTIDFAEGPDQEKQETFCIRFGNSEIANDFRKKYEDGMATNKEIFEKEDVDKLSANVQKVAIKD